MSLQPKQRWTLYSIALALTLAAVFWNNGTSNGAEIAQPTVSASVEPEALPSTEPPAVRNDLIALDRLHREPSVAPTVDPFGPRSWQQLEEEERRAKEPPSPPPPPQAPPVPYSYMGKMIEEDGTVVFLRTGDRSYVARLGDTIDGVWRVEKIGEQNMVLEYVPLRLKQNFSFASGGEPAAPIMRNKIQQTGGEEDPEE